MNRAHTFLSLLSFLVLSSSAFAQSADLVNCKEMPSIVASLSANSNAQIARLSSAAIIEQMRNGAIAEYLEVKTATNAPIKYVPLSSLLANAIHVSEPLLISWTSSDLKFLPSVQQDSQIILIASDTLILDSTKVKSVIATAQRLGITIHTVLLHDDQIATMTLSMLSQRTGGKILDLRPSTCK